MIVVVRRNFFLGFAVKFLSGIPCPVATRENKYPLGGIIIIY